MNIDIVDRSSQRSLSMVIGRDPVLNVMEATQGMCPHGPEPAVCRVLWCPAVSFRVLLYSISCAFVSCFLLCPSGSANA
jgi:hypothetical protein